MTIYDVCNWDVPIFDPPKCNKCGNYTKPKRYGHGFITPGFM